mgnify:CR=1 FL=1
MSVLTQFWVTNNSSFKGSNHIKVAVSFVLRLLQCSILARILSTLNLYLGVVFCRPLVCSATEVVCLLWSRLTPPVAPVRERRPVTAPAGDAL